MAGDPTAILSADEGPAAGAADLADQDGVGAQQAGHLLQLSVHFRGAVTSGRLACRRQGIAQLGRGQLGGDIGHQPRMADIRCLDTEPGRPDLSPLRFG